MKYDQKTQGWHSKHEMTPLDRAIEEYMDQARQYHADKARILQCDEDRELNEKKLSARKSYLSSRRKTIRVQAQVQERLEIYRSSARKDSDNDWVFEECTKSTGRLVQFMEVSGDAKPAKNCHAHHIVPVTGKKTAEQVDARLALHEAGVGINDPQNGVWLPARIDDVPHYLPTLKDALPHLPLHTKAYEVWVSRRIDAAYDEPSARMALINMRSALLSGLHDKTLLNTLTEDSKRRLGL